MKIKRHFAPDMKTALRLVREEQGPDAVILSTRRTDDGVEIVSAREFDPAVVDEGVHGPDREAPLPGGGALWDGTPLAAPAVGRAEAAPNASSAPADIEWAQDPLLREMRSELATLRDLVQYQFGQLAARDQAERDPVRVHLRRRLRRLGLSPRLAATLARRVSARDGEHAWREALRLLTRMVPVLERDLLVPGGALALVGATGVGKTTTIAKLAARFVRRHGAEKLALVTTDNFRVGAESQLAAYGQILGVPVHRATDATALQRLLTALADRLVLIDTAGLGPRDRRVDELHRLLGGNRRITTLLVAAANTQPRALRQVIEALPEGLLAGSVLTKLDEVPGPAEVLSVLIEQRLPLAWISEGQKIPQDLHRARPSDLVARVVAGEPVPVAPRRRRDTLRNGPVEVPRPAGTAL
ncbi:MAG TPA: flagellar biosynthesis protein FlhF [Chromatiales bacterium]|nr:flagellar biosynthesis protein FlhF [Chromatiales bacterium]